MKKSKDVLLIGDTFVHNIPIHDYGSSNFDKSAGMANQLLQKEGFGNAFIRALSDSLGHNQLAMHINTLMSNTTNAAILHLASELYRNNYSYDIVDCSFKHRDKLIRNLSETQYKVIGVSTTCTIYAKYIKYLMDFIKSYQKDAKTILGGMFIVKIFKLEDDVSKLSKLAEYNADYYVFNEVGEQALIEILDYEIRSVGNIHNVNNIAFLTENNYKINGYVPVDLNKSKSDWSITPKSTHAIIRTSKSCLFKCKFCDFPIIADQFQTKTMETIKYELDNIENAGIPYLRFNDDTFNLPKKHFKEILKLLSQSDYSFKWISYIRCQYLDEQSVKNMVDTGCIGVFLGLESGNNRILQNMDKKVQVEEYYRGIEMLKRYGIPIYGTFVVGFPGETEESILDTINFINRTKLDYYRLFVWEYSNLAPISTEKQKYNIIVDENEWKHSTMSQREALEKCRQILRAVRNSVNSTLTYDYTLYLNHNLDTRADFNNALKLYNEMSVSNL